MKDQPKFRAWNTIVKRMSEGATLQQISETENVQWHILIWMQFTGMKDINKKEVYADDIYEYTFIRNGREHKERGKVVWEAGAWMCYDFETGEATHSLNSMIESIEIKGNIHDRPRARAQWTQQSLNSDRKIVSYDIELNI